VKFHRVYIEITNICGLKCSFCTTPATENASMSLKVFENTIKQLPSYTKEVALHILGDPLVLSNLTSYLDILANYNLRAFITTSGYYIKNHTVKTLLHPSVKQINISINSYNKNDNIITFDEYLEPIFELIDSKLANNIEAFINLRIWNLDETMSETNFNKGFFSKVAKHFNITLDSKRIYQEKPKSIRIAYKTLLHFDSYFEWPSLDNPIYGDGTCQGLSSHFGILSNGKVVPCCLDSKGDMELGNITKEPLEKILYNSKSTSIINGFKANKALEELCQRCSYKNRFNKE